MKTTARNGKIDLYKFIFSIVVILYHFGNAVNYKHELFGRGYIGVEFFFLVSGFLFAKSLSKYTYNKETIIPDSLKFMGRKYKSFMPYHIFTCIATIVFCIIVYQWSALHTVFSVINAAPNLFLVQMCGISHFDLLGHEWYLSAMLIAMFVLTPIMIRFGKIYSMYIAPIVVLLFMGMINKDYGSLDVVNNWNGFVCAGLLRAFAEISLGCLCYKIYESKFLEKANKIILLIVELAAYVITLVYANTASKDTSVEKSVEFSILILLALAVTISFSNKTSLKFLNNRFISFLGKLSFPVYLNQIWIRQIVAKWDWQYGYATHAAVYVGCVIVVSLLCIVIMDSIMKLIHKPKKKKPSKTVTA